MIDVDKYIREKYDETYESIKEISFNLNISQSSVYYKLHKMNIYIPQKRSKYSFNESFFKTWSCDMAYIIGFIMADGCISSDRNSLSIVIHEKDIEILDFIKRTMCANHPILRYKTKTTPSIRLMLVSKEMVIDLKRLGIGDRKTNRLVIPTDIPDQYFNDFVRGLFDGDGTAILKRDKELHANIVSVNFTLLDDIRKYYGFGYIKCDSKERNLPLYCWSLSQKDCWKFRNLIYSSNTFALTRKKNILCTNNDREKSWWRPYEIDYIINNYSTKTYKDMSIDLNRSYNAIRFKVKDLRDLGSIKGV